MQFREMYIDMRMDKLCGAESLIIYWCKCNGNTFSSIILRLWVKVRPRMELASPSLKAKRDDHDTTSAGL
jgi:hypothetical protein